MTAHTPGPWRIRKAQDFEKLGWEGDGHPYTIAAGEESLICSGALQNKSTYANAALIAAAPELLAALEFIAGHADMAGTLANEMGREVSLDSIARAARAAIAKAEGRE